MTLCPRCHASISTEDCYCRHCGKALRKGYGFWFSHSGVLLMALCTGPFALITLWLSRKLSLKAKLLWSAGILLFTYYCLWAIWRSMQMFSLLFQALFPADF